MRKTIQCILCSLTMIGLLLMSCPLFAQVSLELLSAQDIWEQAKDKQFTPPDNSKINMTMTLINRKGRKRVRKMVWKRKDYGNGEAKFVASFLAPASIKGTAILTWEHKDQPNDVFLYTPELKKPRRMTSEQRHGTLLGSDFSYSDLERWNLEDADHRILSEQEELNGRACWLVESVPKQGSAIVYSKMISWVDKETYIPHKVEYYKNDELYKILKILRAGPVGNHIWPLHYMMESVKKAHKTEVVFDEIQLDLDIPDKEFTRQALQR